MIKRLLYNKTNKVHRLVICLCVAMLSISASAESYTLSVGESVTITQSAYNSGYIDNVGLANFIDPHLNFSKGWDGSATITVNSYFDYTATVQLVFVEKYRSYYNGRNHTRQETYYRSIDIKCKYTAPDPSKIPTNVTVPERVRVSIYEQVYVTPSIEPYGATVTSISWQKFSGNAYYNLTRSGLQGIVTGKSLGIGRAYVQLNDDENLRAYFDIEVVDPDNLPPTGVILPSSYEVSVGSHTTIEPILYPSSSSTSYTWISDNTNVAIVSGGKVTGIAVGTTTITVKTANNLTTSCTIKVVNANGQDDEADNDIATMGIINGREYVDLGLSVKWATYDVGASKQSEEGPKFAWGETASKTEFSWANYKYGNSVLDVTNIGSDIKGTQYDAAFVKWGGDWCMPSEMEAREMLSKCTFSVDYIDGVKGYRVLGPNGNSIFIPKIGSHWTSSLDSRKEYPEYGTCINIYYNTQIWPYTWVASYAHEMRMKGLRVRAVTSSDATNSGTQPSSISLSVSSMNVQKNEIIPMSFTVFPSNATTTLRWESNNPSVASVSGSGLVTAIKDGTAIISVTAGNGKMAQCTLIVGEGSLEQLQLFASPSGGEVSAGTKVYLNTTNATGADIYYTLNGSTPSKNSTKYTSSGITINSACTLKAIAYKDGYADSEVLTVTYTVKSDIDGATGDGTLQNPFNAIAANKKAGELGVGETSTQRYFVKGMVSSIRYEYSEQYGTATFYISDDGTTSNQFYVSGSYYLENKPWVTGEPQIKIGDHVVVYGKMTNHNGTLETAYRENYVYSHNGKTKVEQTESEGYYYVGGLNGWDITDKSYPFTKLSDGKTWELTMNVNEYDEFKIAIGNTTEWNGNVFGIPFDKDPTVKGGTMIYDYNGSNNFCVTEESGMNSYTIRVIPSEMKYEILVGRNPNDEWDEFGKGTYVYVTDNYTRRYYIYRNKENTQLYKIQGWRNLDFADYVRNSIPFLFSMDTDGKIDVNDQNTGCYSEFYKKDIWVHDIAGSYFDNATNTFFFCIRYYVPDVGAYEKMTELFILDNKVINQHIVSIPSAGYATFYSSESAYVLPEELYAFAITSASDSKITHGLMAAGDINNNVIPKGEAVMLRTKDKRAGTFTLMPTESAVKYTGTNFLRGSDRATITTGDGYHYKLSYGPSSSNLKDVFGWYWGAQNGAPFQIEGHKAWLVVPKTSTRAGGFSIDGDALEVDDLMIDAAEDIDVYDLQGRRVKRPTQKGVYIKNGKKIVNK